MTTDQRIDRRTFLNAAAVGTATIALADTAHVLAASPKAPVTLEFWNPATDVIGRKATADMVNGFNRTVGKSLGIFVHDRPVPGDNYYVKYTTAMTSSGSPDIVMTYNYSTIASWAANGFVQPVDQYARAVGATGADYFPIARDLVYINGHFWGLTQAFCINQLFWNKAIHHGPAPKTIAEFDALAARYTRFDKKGVLIQAGIVPWAQGGYLDWSTLWGGSFYDRTKRKWTINTVQNRRFLDWFLKHVHLVGGRSKADALSVGKANLSDIDPLFESGRTAFTLTSESIPPLFRLESPKLTYGIGQMPTAPGVPYGTATTAAGNAYLLPTRAPHPREAAIFLKYIGSREPVQKWNLADASFPPYRSTIFAPAFVTKMPWMTPFVATLRENHVAPSIPSPHFPLFDDAMTAAVDEVTFKRKTPTQALSDVERKVSSAVQQFKQLHPTWLGE